MDGDATYFGQLDPRITTCSSKFKAFERKSAFKESALMIRAAREVHLVT